MNIHTEFSNVMPAEIAEAMGDEWWHRNTILDFVAGNVAIVLLQEGSNVRDVLLPGFTIGNLRKLGKPGLIEIHIEALNRSSSAVKSFAVFDGQYDDKVNFARSTIRNLDDAAKFLFNESYL